MVRALVPLLQCHSLGLLTRYPEIEIHSYCMYYMNATFMTQVFTCMRQNVTSSFFDARYPSVMEYLMRVQSAM